MHDQAGNVRLQMRGEMIASSKGAIAMLACVWTRTRVLSVMPGELVGACEFPLASFPCTFERPLAGMRARVRFEMRALGVALVAAFVLAGVGSFAFVIYCIALARRLGIRT